MLRPRNHAQTPRGHQRPVKEIGSHKNDAHYLLLTLIMPGETESSLLPLASTVDANDGDGILAAMLSLLSQIKETGSR